MKKKKSIRKTTPKKNLAQFKKLVGKQIKNINWFKVGAYSLAILVVLGVKGVFGPKAQAVAIIILKTTATV